MNSEAEMQTTMPGPGRPIPYDACDNCQYWKRSFKTGSNGICRKNPPVVGQIRAGIGGRPQERATGAASTNDALRVDNKAMA